MGVGVYSLLQGPVSEFCPKCGNFEARKNWPNDFNETSYQPSIGWGLSFGGVGHPVKTLVWPHEGPQKYRLLNRWTDFNEIFQIFRKKYNKNKNFKKLTLTPFLAPWWRHNPLKSAYFSVFLQFQPRYSSFLAETWKNFWKNFIKIENFKKLTLTPFLAHWWRHKPLKLVNFQYLCN